MLNHKKEALLFDIIDCNDQSCIAMVRLNRSKVLNALDKPLIDSLYQQLTKWYLDPKISLVILKSTNPQVFCAGGDIRQLYSSMQEHALAPNPYAAEYFAAEYQLDYLIHRYQKPLIVWGSGLILGGGLGLFWAANHRISTPSTQCGWPEITIGLYPDVGATYALSRLPTSIGLWLGVSGLSLDAKEACYAGLADFYLPETAFDSLLTALTQTQWATEFEVRQLQTSSIIAGFGIDFKDYPPINPSFWGANHNLLSTLNIFQTRNSLISSLRHLKNAVADSNKPEYQWLHQGCINALEGAPRTLAMVLEQCKRGKILTLKECFQLEWQLSTSCAQSADLLEGIRAQIIDKDRNPAWQESFKLDANQDWLESFFDTSSAFKSPMKKYLDDVDDLINQENRVAARSESCR